jgi:hypothetical protein
MIVFVLTVQEVAEGVTAALRADAAPGTFTPAEVEMAQRFRAAIFAEQEKMLLEAGNGGGRIIRRSAGGEG